MSKQNINIKISNDKLSAYLSINNKYGNFPAENEIIIHLNNEGVVFGIDKNQIQKIIHSKKSVDNIIVASGIKPVPGHSAQLVWYLDSEVISDKVIIDEDGHANYKHAKKFNEVKEGEQIVSKLPKTNGKPGKGVTGESIPSSEIDVNLPVGKNVELSEDGLTLYATKTGFLNFHNGQIDISNIFQINGDVSFATGNIKYDGKVLISGDVRSGFRVEATDTIIIEGDVEASEIRSKKGDVIIKMGVLGKGRAKIIAGNNVECGFIQDSEVKANKNVKVQHYIINSNVYAGQKIFVKENEGLVRGGKIFGEKGIEIKEAGSIKNIRTKLGLGMNSNPEQLTQLSVLVKEEDDLYSRYELISKKERFLKLLFERVNILSEEKRNELNSITNELKEIKNRLDEIESKRKELSSQNDDIEKKNKIIINGKIHQGVLLTTGSDELYIDKLYEKVMIYQDLDNIVIDDIIMEQDEK